MVIEPVEMTGTTMVVSTGSTTVIQTFQAAFFNFMLFYAPEKSVFNNFFFDKSAVLKTGKKSP